MVGSDVGRPGTCAPVFEHSRVFQARAVEKLALLPLGSAIAEMLSDHAGMREHAQTGRCQSSNSAPKYSRDRKTRPLEWIEPAAFLSDRKGQGQLLYGFRVCGKPAFLWAEAVLGADGAAHLQCSPVDSPSDGLFRVGCFLRHIEVDIFVAEVTTDTLSKRAPCRMIDVMDRKILSVLLWKATTMKADMARQVGVAPSVVSKRVRRIEIKSLIEGKGLRVSAKALGKPLLGFYS